MINECLWYIWCMFSCLELLSLGAQGLKRLRVFFKVNWRFSQSKKTSKSVSWIVLKVFLEIITKSLEVFGIHHSNLGVLSLIRLKLFSACWGIWNVDKSENGHNFMKQLRDGRDFMKQLREIGVFFSILWCSHMDDHPQEKLAKLNLLTDQRGK